MSTDNQIARTLAQRMGDKCEREGKDTFTFGEMRREYRKMFETTVGRQKIGKKEERRY